MVLKLTLGIVSLLALAASATGQYTGPALLGRGEAPAAMAAPQISFRPYVHVGGSYDTGLAGVAVNDSGELGNYGSYGITASWGVSGAHSWRHTTLGLDYRGSVYRRTQRTSFDTVNQALLLGVTHDITRHVRTMFHASSGTFSRDFGLLGMAQTVPFDPITTYIPRTDFFDNRTNYLSSGANLVVQKTARLSFGLGGAGFLARRRSSALTGINGAEAKADVHYRISRRSTIGAMYGYTRFFFTRADSTSDLHSFALSYGVRFTRWWELSAYGGAMHMESKYVQAVRVDPVIAAILGIAGSSQIVHRVQWTPNVAARLTRTFSRGLAHASAARSISPGNGLFLTSAMTTVMGGYSYTGLRRWSFTASGALLQAKSLVNVTGHYNTATASISASRKIMGSLHAVALYSLRKYSSSDFDKYNRVIQSATIGIGFTPGDVPLRVW